MRPQRRETSGHSIHCPPPHTLQNSLSPPRLFPLPFHRSVVVFSCFRVAPSTASPDLAAFSQKQISLEGSATIRQNELCSRTSNCFSRDRCGANGSLERQPLQLPLPPSTCIHAGYNFDSFPTALSWRWLASSSLSLSPPCEGQFSISVITV